MENTPKLKKTERKGIFDWYPYYAGYSPRFVSEILKKYSRDNDLVFDPWIGSGTTTSIATSFNLNAIGQDVNPALTTVARAKLAAGAPESVISGMFEEWISYAQGLRGKSQPNPKEDALRYWYRAGSVRAIRRYTEALTYLDTAQFKGASCEPRYADAYVIDLFKLILFRVLRSELKPFATSNPTWVKVAKSDSERRSTSSRKLMSQITQAKIAISRSGYSVDGRTAPRRPNAQILEGSSSSIHLPDRSVDLVVTSPPYCTRIDYIRATLPELAMLSRDGEESIQRVADRTIGHTTTDKEIPNIAEDAPYASTLSAIRTHSSKASDSYYYRYFATYFNQMDRSLSEIARVLRSTACAILVLQDSHYKDVHIDLVGIVRELGENLGMRSEVLHANYVTRSYSNIHPYRGRYRSSSEATESVVRLSW